MPDLIYGEDGSLTITLSEKNPEDAGVAANWLPTGQGEFYLHVRFYAPTKPVISLTYRLPDVVRAMN